MDEQTKYILSLMRMGMATTYDANYLQCAIVKLKKEIKQLKGDLNEQEDSIEKTNPLCNGDDCDCCVNRV